MAYIYTQENGTVASCSLQSSIPEGAEWVEGSLPADRIYWSACRIINGEIAIDEAVKAEIDYQFAKVSMVETIDQLTVTTNSGKTFDGDEISQGRMARAVTASEPGDTTNWKLADNSLVEVTHEELKEALLLAGQAQTSLLV